MLVGINTLFLIPGKVGGTETYARGLIDALSKLKSRDQYLLFCNRENYSTFEANSKNVDKVFCGIKASLRPVRILYEQIFLPFQLWRKKIGVLLSLGYSCPLFMPCKSIVVIYDLNWFFHPEEFTFFSRVAWKTLVTLSAKRADHIITSSENSKKDIIRILKVDSKKVSVVYGGIDAEKFKPEKGKDRILKIQKKYGIKQEFLLTASASYKFKNLGRLIDAFKIVTGAIPDLQLLVVGLGGRGKSEMITKIKNYYLEDKVIIAGWVDDEDIPVLYSAEKVYIHPSLYEGFGFPVLEAMACGCPVVSSKVASLPELVGEAGVLIDATKAQEMAGAMARLIKDNSLALEYIKKGQKQSKLFTWEKSARQVKAIYTELMG